MSDSTNERPLPPPAFPPGSRRHAHRNSKGASPARPPLESLDEAFISPDEPLPDRVDPMSDAFISPDEPLPERFEIADAYQDAHAAGVRDEGEVVGMDLDPHLEYEDTGPGGDPYVRNLVEALSTLAAAVRHKGEAGLRATPEMSRFEATLRAYCVGYLAGRRAEEPPPREIEEALPTDG